MKNKIELTGYIDKIDNINNLIKKLNDEIKSLKAYKK